MGNVVEFKPRAKPAPEAPVPATAPDSGACAATMPRNLRDLAEQGAVQSVLAALLFYANQGHDDGQRARLAVDAMLAVLNGPPGAA